MAHATATHVKGAKGDFHKLDEAIAKGPMPARRPLDAPRSSDPLIYRQGVLRSVHPTSRQRSNFLLDGSPQNPYAPLLGAFVIFGRVVRRGHQGTATRKGKNLHSPKRLWLAVSMERATGVEPATSTLARLSGSNALPAPSSISPGQSPFSGVGGCRLFTAVFVPVVDQTSGLHPRPTHCMIRGEARFSPEEPCSRRSASPPQTGSCKEEAAQRKSRADWPAPLAKREASMATVTKLNLSR